MFSGSVVVDYTNTAGFNKRNTPALVAIYTADNPEGNSMAWTKDVAGKNTVKSVIDSKAKWNSKDTRDPKVF